MTGISIVRLADKYAVAKDRETVAPLLVMLDENQDGEIEKKEVQDPKGFFRCGGWVGRMGAGRWRSLEKILTDSGLVDHKSKKACGKTAAKLSELPVAPDARFPAAYESLFFSLPFDWVFVFKPDVTPKKILHVLKSKGKVAQKANGEIEVTFKSGRKATLFFNRFKLFQKVAYTDANVYIRASGVQSLERCLADLTGGLPAVQHEQHARGESCDLAGIGHAARRRLRLDGCLGHRRSAGVPDVRLAPRCRGGAVR